MPRPFKGVARLCVYEDSYLCWCTLYLRACLRVREDDAHIYTCDVVWAVHSVSVAGLRWHLRLYSVCAFMCMSLCL
jgi:hypothetical protein